MKLYLFSSSKINLDLFILKTTKNLYYDALREFAVYKDLNYPVTNCNINNDNITVTVQDTSSFELSSNITNINYFYLSDAILNSGRGVICKVKSISRVNTHSIKINGTIDKVRTYIDEQTIYRAEQLHGGDMINSRFNYPLCVKEMIKTGYEPNMNDYIICAVFSALPFGTYDRTPTSIKIDPTDLTTGKAYALNSNGTSTFIVAFTKEIKYGNFSAIVAPNLPEGFNAYPNPQEYINRKVGFVGTELSRTIDYPLDFSDPIEKTTLSDSIYSFINYLQTLDYISVGETDLNENIINAFIIPKFIINGKSKIKLNTMLSPSTPLQIDANYKALYALYDLTNDTGENTLNVCGFPVTIDLFVNVFENIDVTLKNYAQSVYGDIGCKWSQFIRCYIDCYNGLFEFALDDLPSDFEDVDIILRTYFDGSNIGYYLQLQDQTQTVNPSCYRAYGRTFPLFPIMSQGYNAFYNKTKDSIATKQLVTGVTGALSSAALAASGNVPFAITSGVGTVTSLINNGVSYRRERQEAVLNTMELSGLYNSCIGIIDGLFKIYVVHANEKEVDIWKNHIKYYGNDAPTILLDCKLSVTEDIPSSISFVKTNTSVSSSPELNELLRTGIFIYATTDHQMETMLATVQKIPLKGVNAL